MKLDHIIKVLFVIMLIMLVATSVFTYGIYNDLCNNSQNYQSVELLESDSAYSVCGADFGIVNTGTSQISVTELKGPAGLSETDNEQLEEVATTNVEPGSTLAIEASEGIYYQISNPLGSNLEQTIQVRKF